MNNGQLTLSDSFDTELFSRSRHYPDRLPPARTPWGQSDNVTKIADGLYFVGTASHGGIWVSRERLAEMPACLLQETHYAPPPWFEEDCEWGKVALVFPDCFKPEDIRNALAVGERYWSEALQQFHQTPAGKRLAAHLTAGWGKASL